MKTKTPSFSIIMPTYNRAFCIENAIRHILAQTYQNFELIIVDDGSTDGTDNLIKSKFFPEIQSGKIKYHQLPHNCGVCAARNTGLSLATHNWIAYCDTDNWVRPNFLASFADAIIRNPKSKTFYAQIQHKNTGRIVGHAFNYAKLCKSNFIDMGVFCHHKDLVAKYGGFDTKLRRLVDWDLILTYTKKHKPVFIEKVLLDYNDSNSFNRITNLETLNIEYICKKHNISPNSTGVSDMAHKIFYKERCPNGRRHIYFCGIKILSYKKHHKRNRIIIRDNTAFTQQIARYCGEDRLPILLRDRFYERTGKLPTEELNTLNEKIIWASMFDVTPLKTQLADKYTVRNYVSQTIGSKYLIKLLGCWENINEVNFDQFPTKFVLKHSDGSGKVHLIPNKHIINMSDIKSVLRKWELDEFWTLNLEMQYKNSVRKFIAEEYLDTKIEYKLWCFGGKCRFIKIEIMNEFATNGKPENQTGKYFYPDWSPADFKTVGAEPTTNIPKPIKLKELLTIAEKLAQPFDFVRVDFFETQTGELKFGEMTFSPAAGNIHFTPSEKDIEFGKLFKIPPRDKNGFSIR